MLVPFTDLRWSSRARARGLWRRARSLALCAVVIAVIASGHSPGADPLGLQECRLRQVSREELLEAMRPYGRDYSLAATTNAGRFQADVLFGLIRRASALEPEGGPLFIDQEDWYWAYLQVSGLEPEEVPISARLAYEHRQSWQIEYRFDHVIEAVEEGPAPEQVLNVRISWPEVPGGPGKYSYRDTLSTPELKVTSHRVITHRLLDFDDMVLYDEVEGLSGRPTSGFLGALFSVIGEAGVKWSRIAISEDGLQVVRARSKKLMFGVTATVTIQPNGRAERGLPPGRPDLVAIEERLKRPLKISYMPNTLVDCEAIELILQ